MTQHNQDFSPAEKEALRFLERDFNQCFQQMRHDDDQICGLLKFAFTSYTALVGFALGLYQFGLKQNVVLNCPVLLMIAIGLIVGVFIFSMTVRKRVYFVQLARYVNEQRGLFFVHMPLEFKNAAGMYINPSEPSFFNWCSYHSWIIYLLALLNAVLLGVFLYIADGVSVFSTVPEVIMVFIIQLLAAVLYLKTREKKTA